ncbi:MAG: NAD(P)H-hydrate dehydratase [Candidatus Omnitrophica bacterium]|nr:NAD(P)H-hydrate dehydratase [Candidatus Omnitrophota bacterium]
MVREHIDKIPSRRKDSHKGDYGKVLVLAGSRGMTGAAFLCSQGALHSGSGLVINGIPESLNPVMEVKLTEVMTLPLHETPEQALGHKAKADILAFSKKCDVVAMGPGMGTADSTKTLVKDLLNEIEIPLVLDADGINCLEGDIDILGKRSFRTVITPHPGELARLTGKTATDIQANREDITKSIAEVTETVVVLKGYGTVVASPDGKVYVNQTGNSGMASGGTGDVLTGMIASFIGQGIDDYSASVCAVYLHGTAGDIAAEEVGQFSMTASDILDLLPEAFDRAGI